MSTDKLAAFACIIDRGLLPQAFNRNKYSSKAHFKNLQDPICRRGNQKPSSFWLELQEVRSRAHYEVKGNPSS